MTRIAIQLPDDVLATVEEMVRAGRFPDRSAALAEGVRILERQHKLQQQYEDALHRLDPDEEKRDANAFLSAEDEWPTY